MPKMILMDTLVDYECSTPTDAVEAIREEYDRSDISIDALLLNIELQGFSIQDVVDIFATTTSEVEQNKLIYIIDDNCVERGIV